MTEQMAQTEQMVLMEPPPRSPSGPSRQGQQVGVRVSPIAEHRPPLFSISRFHEGQQEPPEPPEPQVRQVQTDQMVRPAQQGRQDRTVRTGRQFTTERQFLLLDSVLMEIFSSGQIHLRFMARRWVDRGVQPHHSSERQERQAHRVRQAQMEQTGPMEQPEPQAHRVHRVRQEPMGVMVQQERQALKALKALKEIQEIQEQPERPDLKALRGKPARTDRTEQMEQMGRPS